MGEGTGISWCDDTFNPWWGCVKVSAGCRNCYAETLSKRWGGPQVWGRSTSRRLFGGKHWNDPVRWNRKAKRDGVRRRVFCGSMCDVFEDHPDLPGQRARLFSLIRGTPWLDWLVLTKRPENLERMLPEDWTAPDGDAWPNVWLGVSVEDSSQEHRIDILRGVQAIVRFVSYEPALGPLTESSLGRGGIDFLIYGGESGPGHRPDDPEWARWAREACARYGAAFWFKQRSGRRPGNGELDGATPRELPYRRWERLSGGAAAHPEIAGAAK